MTIEEKANDIASRLRVQSDAIRAMADSAGDLGFSGMSDILLHIESRIRTIVNEIRSLKGGDD